MRRRPSDAHRSSFATARSPRLRAPSASTHRGKAQRSPRSACRTSRKERHWRGDCAVRRAAKASDLSRFRSSARTRRPLSRAWPWQAHNGCVSELNGKRSQLNYTTLWREANLFFAGSRHSSEVRGLLAAWAADESLLGRGRIALTWLERHAFVLSGLYDEQQSGSAQSYLKHLRAFLRRTGYLS
jgi:hypothetical protein